MTTLARFKELGALLALWLLGIGLALAQAGNSIEAFDVAQQGGNVVIRITTKEPLKAVPPSFTVANPARIVFDFANTSNGAWPERAGCRAGRVAQHEPGAGLGPHAHGAQPAPLGGA